MTLLVVIVGTWLGVGLAAYSAWAVKVFATSTLAKDADLTTRLVYRTGQAVIWGASGMIASSFAGLVAAAVLKALR